MASKITQQQREDLKASNGRPVPIEDDEAGKVYYLVEPDYLHTSHDQLKALIQAGIEANHIPAEEAESQLRHYADQLSRKLA